MDIKEIESIIEGILFASGDAVHIEKLSDILQIDKNTLRSIMNRMMDYYSYERRGIQIIEIDNCYQLCTRPEYYEYIRKLVEPKHKQGLSNAALETLAIIAYNQPVTRSDIEQIRGVNCDSALNRLLDRGLIEEKGRLDAPGKPILYRTTREFLRCFGLRSLEELPQMHGLDELTILEKE
ncbi:MAG: segregation and condensation protein [Petroclostridium sp.]|jgi:segregation and condensation protein B|uniref:SMC-Scp complex subunit ScpB n=1 Tax=Petroclostridium xylanilyticum TaxID=1792311 RepID=UPI000B97D541|nr:SMC-Scp complex subunit ScpB [Petroclostridium xylanilyticum]MBZ4646826.1 scpB [Clostridia bacterium]MDK2811552.1 segregation and condensation protein [Petroclostridium sp.]